MRIRRLYTGDDGQSHLEELDLESHPDLTILHAAKGIFFRVMEPGYSGGSHRSDRHAAPQRHYAITLSGEVEIGLGDGTVHRFVPGDVNLVEDLTGQGHTTRVIGNQPRISAIIRL